MLVDKNTKRAVSENVEFKRIMSEGGVLWEKLFRWTRQRVSLRRLGYAKEEPNLEDMKKKYPGCIYFEFIGNAVGMFEILSYYPVGEIEIVSSENKNAYPLKGVYDGFYFELIN